MKYMSFERLQMVYEAPHDAGLSAEDLDEVGLPSVKLQVLTVPPGFTPVCGRRHQRAAVLVVPFLFARLL